MDNARFVLTSAGVAPRRNHNAKLAIGPRRLELHGWLLSQNCLGRCIVNG
jgi:hypothetical protein